MSNWTHPRPSLSDRLREAAAMIQFETGSRLSSAASLPTEASDKIDGLEADLHEAIKVAFKYGATDWVRLNYPEVFKTLNERKPEEQTLGADVKTEEQRCAECTCEHGGKDCNWIISKESK